MVDNSNSNLHDEQMSHDETDFLAAVGSEFAQVLADKVGWENTELTPQDALDAIRTALGSWPEPDEFIKLSDEKLSLIASELKDVFPEFETLCASDLKPAIARVKARI